MQPAGRFGVRHRAQQAVLFRREGPWLWMAGNSQLAAAMADGRSQTPYPLTNGWVRHGSQQPILCPCPCPAPPDCGNAQLATVLSHDRGVTAYEPGDLGVHSNAQVVLFRAFPSSRSSSFVQKYA